jgi:hypothetical protein
MHVFGDSLGDVSHRLRWGKTGVVAPILSPLL